MSPTHYNVGKIWLTGQCRNTDIIFCVAFPAHFNVGKCQHFIIMQKYHTVDYIYRVHLPTHNSQLEPPPPYSHRLFPPPLFPWVQQRCHPITAPPLPHAMRRPQAVGIRLLSSVRLLGRTKREGSKNRAMSGGCLGLRVAAILRIHVKNQIKVGVLDRGRVGKDAWLWWNVWGDAVLSVWLSN
jgi:hypothetical protein